MIAQISVTHAEQVESWLQPTHKGCRYESGREVRQNADKGRRVRRTGVGSGGYAGDLTPQLFMWGYTYVYPLEYLIPSHANCMQHVLRCWEKQSDGSEYKKTLQRTPLWDLAALPQTPWLVRRGLLPPPQNPIPHYVFLCSYTITMFSLEPHPPLSALRASPLLPHSKISSDVVGSSYADVRNTQLGSKISIQAHFKAVCTSTTQHSLLNRPILRFYSPTSVDATADRQIPDRIFGPFLPV